MLGLPGETPVPWAVFDVALYAATCPEAPAGGPEAARLHYLAHGQSAGRSPNRWCDEAWMRATLPPPGAEAASCFDAYCRAGGAGASPHWLFEEALYRARYPDLTAAALAAGGFVNGYDHYLRLGDREGRSGSLFLDPAHLLAHLPPGDAAAAAACGCFAWYLDALAAGREEPEASPWFDPVWYRARAPEAGATGLRHYLSHPPGQAPDPLPWFSEAYYLARYPDVAEAVRAGIWRSGYQHFLHHGAFERRSPCAALDLSWYAESDPSVSEEIAAGLARDPFAHFLRFGRTRGLPGAPLPVALPGANEAAALLARRAEALLPGLARHGLDFTLSGPAEIAVVVLLRASFTPILLALAALRAGFGAPIELILVGCGANDETGQITRYVSGATWLDFAQDIGWLAGVNVGLAAAVAPAVLLLAPDVELLPGSLAAGLRRLDADASAGAIGGRLLRAEGVIAEAGAILWRDGSLTPYQPGAAPLAPEVSFLRAVDACAPDLLLLRRASLPEGGFDAAFAAAPLAAVADLALRLAATGPRLLFDPALVAQSLGIAPIEVESRLVEAAPLLLARHGPALRFRALPDPARAVHARTADPGPRRLLFIDDTTPVRRAGSGFVRSADLVGAMVELGWAVSVLGMERSRFHLAAQFADLPDTVEVLHDHGAAEVAGLLDARAGFYDVIWIARTHNLHRLRPILERSFVGLARRPAIVLDTEAVAALRGQAQARLTAPAVAFDLDQALTAELRDAEICRHVVAVSAAEAALLRRCGLPSVSVIGHSRAPAPTPRPFAARGGMLFLGAMHEPGAPNHDALDWFATAVLPRIETALRWETRLTVAGYLGPGVDLSAYRDHPRISLRGPVAALAPLYDAHRVFVAPTRFAAGLPYKLHEAASFGLPIVATGLLARQLGWEDALLAAEADDAEGFAAAVVRLYRDPSLWERLRAAALARIAAETGPAAILAALRAVLDDL